MDGNCTEFERRLKTRIDQGSEPIRRKTHGEDAKTDRVGLGNVSEDGSGERKGQERDEPRMGEGVPKAPQVLWGRRGRQQCPHPP